MSWILSPSTGVGTLELVGDVTLSSIASGELISWNGAAWVNQTPAELGITVVGQNVQNGDYTLLISDVGQMISKQSGGAGETITIPADTSPSVAAFDSDAFDDTNAFADSSFTFTDESGSAISFDIGTMIAIDNNGGDDLSIVIDTDTLIWARNNLTGPRTLADGGLAVLLKVNDTVWKIAGEGVT